MKISTAGINLIKSFEGCRLTAYKCPAGVWTIGYGHTGSDVKEGLKITQAKATSLLKKDLERFEKNVSKYDAKYHFNQNQFDALVAFAFNIGSIDQLTANGTRTIKQISEKMLAYNKAGGKVLAGLVRRRRAEQDLFNKSVKSVKSTKSKGYTVKVTATNGLNVRKGPGVQYSVVRVLKRSEKVEVIEEKSGWGNIKAGWINLKYTAKV